MLLNERLSRPRVEAFFDWSEQQLLRIPGKSDLAKAFRYGLNPQAYLTDVLNRLHDHKINKLDELLPWNWKVLNSEASSQAA